MTANDVMDREDPTTDGVEDASTAEVDAEDARDLLLNVVEKLQAGAREVYAERSQLLLSLQRDEVVGALAEFWRDGDAETTSALNLLAEMPGVKIAGKDYRRSVIQRAQLLSADAIVSAPTMPVRVWLSDEMVRKLPEDVAELRLPRGYSMNKDGVFRASEASLQPTAVCRTPLILGGREVDAVSGNTSLTLLWWQKENKVWRRASVPREKALNNRQIIALAGVDFPVSSSKTTQVTDYIAAFEAQNRGELPQLSVSSRLGWWSAEETIGDDGVPRYDAFILPDTVFSVDGGDAPVSFQCGDPGFAKLASSVRAVGSWEGWLEAAEMAADYPLLFIAVYAAVASILLPIIPGAANFTLSFSEETSAGKTTAMAFGASVWGLPSDTGGYISSWAMPSVAWAERIAGQLYCLPLLLDETKRVRKVEFVPAFVFQQWQGSGVQRANNAGGTDVTSSWRSVLVSTGEGPIASLTPHLTNQIGGLAARVLEVRGRPTGKECEENRLLADRLRKQLMANYGWLGPATAQALIAAQEPTDEYAGWAGLVARFEELRAWMTSREDIKKSAIGSRVAAYAATLALASEVVHDVMGVPRPKLDPVALLLDNAFGLNAIRDRAVRVMMEFRQWLVSNDHRFVGRHQMHNGRMETPHGGWCGEWAAGEAFAHVYVMASSLDYWLARRSLVPVEIIDAWIDRGYVKGTRQAPTTMRVVRGLSVPCYVIAADALTGAL